MTLKQTVAKLGRALRNNSGEPVTSEKYLKEAQFWRKFLTKLSGWYRGEVPEFYQTPAPAERDQVRAHPELHGAILTWFELHQKPKYLADLRLDPDAFAGMRVLDVGSGPMPSAEAFRGCELYCLDPLLPAYLEAGFPLHIYRGSTHFVHGHAEAMPLESGFFDAVISVNAIDHVDDIHRAAVEIGRVIKPGGLVRLHVHYHLRTRTEPLELNDAILKEAFAWCPGFHKIAVSDRNFSGLAGPGECYTLWSNF